MSIYPNWLGTCTGGAEPGDCPPCIEVPLLQASTRRFTTRRVAIANALQDKLKQINGSYPFKADVEDRVYTHVSFLDDVEVFPTIFIDLGYESRVYSGGGFKERYLPIRIKCYVYDDDNSDKLGLLLEDVEALLETNSRLRYVDSEGVEQYTFKITVLSVSTQEVNSPNLYGEIACEVMY